VLFRSVHPAGGVGILEREPDLYGILQRVSGGEGTVLEAA
jgi:hypothetical protein